MPIPRHVFRPKDNRLLAVLPAAELERLSSRLELIELMTDDVLWKMNERVNHLYFPASCLISLFHENRSGASVAVATIGRASAVGSRSLIGGTRSTDRAAVVMGGTAFRLNASHVQSEIADCGEFQSLLLTFTHSLTMRISQTAVCYRLHRIDQQLCSWLLSCRDEIQNDILQITHEQIANVLGIRRETVSLAASRLQKMKLISNSRGRIRILDPTGLAAEACECYSVMRENFAELLHRYTTQSRT